MSTMEAGHPCAECLQTGRCLADCVTQGSGAFIASGFSPEDGRLIAKAALHPHDDAPGVVLVACGPGAKMVNNLTVEAAEALRGMLDEAIQAAKRINPKARA